jgi:TAG lipase / steryl ester hydrolase / phospholipase A2 / LPA acyltransferase
MLEPKRQGGYHHGAASVERTLQDLSRRIFLQLPLHPRTKVLSLAHQIFLIILGIIHKRSESESDTIDLNSWTRSGGPLMRTSSADKFINFIHNLEIDTEFSRACTVEDDTTVIFSESTFPSDPRLNNSSRVTTPDPCTEVSENSRTSQASTPTGIAVSEGDLLQPERTTDGILLNIVRRDVMLSQHNGTTEPAETSVEAYVETRTCDAISGSDCADDNNVVVGSSNPSVDHADFVTSQGYSVD